MGEITDAVKGLPLAKRATPQQMILLIVVAGAIFYGGFRASQAVQDITAGIARVEGKTDALAAKVDWLRSSGWSRDDQRDWVADLDHLNRQTVPALIVPPVKAATAQPAN